MLSVVPHCALLPMRPCRIEDILCFIHALVWEHLACIIGQIMSAQHALGAFRRSHICHVGTKPQCQSDSGWQHRTTYIIVSSVPDLISCSCVDVQAP